MKKIILIALYGLIIQILILLFTESHGIEGYRFLVYRTKIPALSTVETNIKAKGITAVKTAGQPFRLTNYLIAPNTNYATLYISLNNSSDRTYVDTMAGNNYVLFLSSFDAIGSYDNRIGGNVTTWVCYEKNKLPADYYTVRGSTK